MDVIENAVKRMCAKGKLKWREVHAYLDTLRACRGGHFSEKVITVSLCYPTPVRCLRDAKPDFGLNHGPALRRAFKKIATVLRDILSWFVGCSIQCSSLDLLYCEIPACGSANPCKIHLGQAFLRTSIELDQMVGIHKVDLI